MRIKTVNSLVRKQLAKLGLVKKFEKQKALFESNLLHPSLHTEKLEPKSIGLYSLRIDKKHRAIFRIRDGLVEIIHVTKHYQK